MECGQRLAVCSCVEVSKRNTRRNGRKMALKSIFLSKRRQSSHSADGTTRRPKRIVISVFFFPFVTISHFDGLITLRLNDSLMFNIRCPSAVQQHQTSFSNCFVCCVYISPELSQRLLQEICNTFHCRYSVQHHSVLLLIATHNNIVNDGFVAVDAMPRISLSPSIHFVRQPNVCSNDSFGVCEYVHFAMLLLMLHRTQHII